MSWTPRISVVIDSYNYARYLPACLDSVLSQDYPSDRLEVIVVDDGSTDGSPEVLRRYAPRVRAIVQPNQGQATAFNRGLGEATGEIVCLLDSDDAFMPGKLRAVIGAFERHPEAGAVQHFLQEADVELRPLPQEFPAWPERYTLEDFLDGRTAFTAISGLSFRAERLRQVLPLPKEIFYYIDDLLLAGVLFHAPVANIARPFAYHRVHGSNSSVQGFGDPRKLALDFRMRSVFRARVDQWLSESGRSLTPRYARLDGLERTRREVLLHMLEGRRAEAARAWKQGLARYADDGFGRFRMATCALALLSPGLYLRLYRGYAAAGAAKSLRRGLLPA